MASYPASQELLSYVGGIINVAGSPMHLREISITGDNGLAVDRHLIRQSQLKKEQTPAAMVELSGSLTAEFEDLTAYNRFVNGTLASVVAKWQGSLIEGALFYHVEVTLPAVRFDGETPAVGGPEILQQALPWKALNNGTDAPITIVARTTDTAS